MTTEHELRGLVDAMRLYGYLVGFIYDDAGQIELVNFAGRRMTPELAAEHMRETLAAEREKVRQRLRRVKIRAEITPESTQEMADTINDCDTAFAVLSICDGLTPQARSTIKEAWHAVQSVLAELKGPGSAYAMAVAENRAAGKAP